uniref:Uncharacterized protein n=1 Tax=Avena sativa TaxID=4498 RepID=A0ACD5XFF8_AVESA
MALFRHFVLALVLVMTTFSTVEMSTHATHHSRKPHPHLQPLSPGGYRTYIVLLKTPTGRGGGDMDSATRRSWYESFLPTKMTRDGQHRLLRSYTTVVNGFSALLTDEEVKLVAEKPGFITAIPNPSATGRRHARLLFLASEPASSLLRPGRTPTLELGS